MNTNGNNRAETACIQKMAEERRNEIERFLSEAQNDPIGPTTEGPWSTDAYYALYGEGAEEHEVKITVFEMVLLYEHWAKMSRAVDVSAIFYGTWGGWENRMSPHSEARLAYFANFIGDDKAIAIWADLYPDFPPPQEPWDWLESTSWTTEDGQDQPPTHSVKCALCSISKETDDLANWYSLSAHSDLGAQPKSEDLTDRMVQVMVCPKCRMQLADFYICAETNDVSIEWALAQLCDGPL